MKKFILASTIFCFGFGTAQAAKPCTQFGGLQRVANYKECMSTNTSAISQKAKSNENKVKLKTDSKLTDFLKEKKIDIKPNKIKSSKFKLKTDSKLTDYIKNRNKK